MVAKVFFSDSNPVFYSEHSNATLGLCLISLIAERFIQESFSKQPTERKFIASWVCKFIQSGINATPVFDLKFVGIARCLFDMNLSFKAYSAPLSSPKLFTKEVQIIFGTLYRTELTFLISHWVGRVATFTERKGLVTVIAFLALSYLEIRGLYYDVFQFPVDVETLKDKSSTFKQNVELMHAYSLPVLIGVVGVTATFFMTRQRINQKLLSFQ